MNPTELEIFKESILEKIREEKEWYKKSSETKKRTSKTLRALAIIFIGLGTLCPLIESTRVFEDMIELSRWGYVCFAIGGIFIGYDKFFGVSSGWIRYTRSIMEIDKLTNDFEFDWKSKFLILKPGEFKEEQILESIQLLRTFLGGVQEIVIKETNNWANEFQNSLQELSKSTSSGTS